MTPIVSLFAAPILAIALASSHLAAAEPALTGTVKNFERATSPKSAVELSWRGPNGAEVTLSRLKGKVVLLNLWATWCAPCIRELPSLQRLQAKLSRESSFVLIAVSIDRGPAGGTQARDMLRRLKLDELAFHHDREGRVFPALGVTVMPTTMVFDRSGREVGRLEGPAEWDAPEAEALIRSFIE